MGKFNYCQACQNDKFGVKTRLPVEHTCGLSYEERKADKKEFDSVLSEQFKDKCLEYLNTNNANRSTK
jgi:hypothetical protein